MAVLFVLAPLARVSPLHAGRAAGEPSGKRDFDRTIAPLLAEHCLDCHSGAKPKGRLDLSQQKTALKGGKSGPAVVPGKLDDSVLWERVNADEMPPKHPLAAADKKKLREWIVAGAVWGDGPIDPFRYTTGKRAGYDWWSLRAVQRPERSGVQAVGWPHNAIDFFVLDRLEQAGLAPSAEADRRTLIRRLSYDLIGLPPSPEEVETFVADARPDAYELLVNRLLASPHYGERWARHWLDVVRFGESGGFERNDPRPTAWRYRDWVIAALNADLPYDEFCRLQIAGDVLRPGEPAAIDATGFLVAGIHNTVVPANKIAEETAFHDELEDLVGSVGQTFLGLTANCARCHDHKFDPVSARDYYRLASALSGVKHGERAVVIQPNQTVLDKLLVARDVIEQRLTQLEEPARKAVLAERAKGQAPMAKPPMPMAAWDFRDGGKDRYGTLHVQSFGGAKLTPEGLVLDGKNAFARSAPLEGDLKARTLEAWVKLDNLMQRGGGAFTLQTPDGFVFDAIVFGEREPGQWMAGSDGFRRTASFQAPEERDATKRPLHFAIVYDADGTITGYRDGKPYGKPYRSAGLVPFQAGKAVAAFGVRHEPVGGNKMLAGIVVQARLFNRALTAAEVAASAGHDEPVTEAELLARFDAKDRQQWDLLRASRDLVAPQVAALRAKQVSFKVYAPIPQQPAPMRIMHRGQVTEPGELIAPAGIAAVAGPSADFKLAPDAPEGLRRRKLAEWITHKDNPLFARVMVNRLWHYHFGIGLVETPNDFGFNGGRPSHPELLDWLASEFIAQGYRLKDMHRLIVTSRTYRQSSTPRPDAIAKDADNRLVWRKKPMRMEGEALRDTLLAIAGLLNPEVGGKGFSDYKQIANSGTMYYDPIDPVGREFHRRSIYRFQPRGASLGLLDAFDCPDPAAAAPRRNATTTPLQAMALWNGGFALRMADALATRVAGESGNDIGRQAARVYQLILQRPPTAVERDRAARLIEAHGLRALCRAMLNSNEFLTVD
jgi:Protein of unknown function (DUF1553)/Protein of unknown function (DUF1549)/Planctomycete cytochrome C/Concanavalin A-like lectin/glucanases superfamily